MIEVKAEDRNDNQLKYGESSADTSSNGSLVIDSEHQKEFKAMKLQLERQRRVVLKFRQKMEKDLKLQKDEGNRTKSVILAEQLCVKVGHFLQHAKEKGSSNKISSIYSVCQKKNKKKSGKIYSESELKVLIQ